MPAANLSVFSDSVHVCVSVKLFTKFCRENGYLLRKLRVFIMTSFIARYVQQEARANRCSHAVYISFLATLFKPASARQTKNKLSVTGTATCYMTIIIWTWIWHCVASRGLGFDWPSGGRRNTASNTWHPLPNNIKLRWRCARRSICCRADGVVSGKADRTRAKCSWAVNRHRWHSADHAMPPSIRWWRGGGDRLNINRGRHVGEHLHVFTAQSSRPTAFFVFQHRHRVRWWRRATAELRIDDSCARYYQS